MYQGVLGTEVTQVGKEANFECQERLVEFPPVVANEPWKHMNQGYDIVRARTQHFCSSMEGGG